MNLRASSIVVSSSDTCVTVRSLILLSVAPIYTDLASAAAVDLIASHDNSPDSSSDAVEGFGMTDWYQDWTL